MKINILFLILFYLLQNSSSYDYNYEEYVTVEEENYAVPRECRGYCDENGFREKRSGSQVKSHVLEAMMSTKVLPLKKDEPDIFAFLRDQYELPKGMYKIYFIY